MNDRGPRSTRVVRLTLAAIVAASTAANSAGIATAQHANFVLFGAPSAEALEVPDYRRAVAPLTSPFYADDAFITSDVRGVWMHHSFPEPRVGGGSVTAYALQLRVALTRSLQLVASKLGALDFDSPLADGESGSTDVAVGLKWAFLQDWDSDTHASVGLGYQVGVGDEEVLQGSDEVRLWGALNKNAGRFHFGMTANYLVAVGEEDALGDSDRLFVHLHSDYWFDQFYSAVFELNYYDTVRGNSGSPYSYTGVDLANLGGGSSNDACTFGYGFELRPANAFALRSAHESTLAGSDTVFGHRWTLSAQWSF